MLARDRDHARLIVERVGRAKYDRFIFCLMGPYSPFNLNYVLSEEEHREIDEAQVSLWRVEGQLRVDPGIDAFLALDVDTDDVDGATQSIESARRSNATAFVLPFLGHNFGVGEEAGSILEALSETHGDRLLFVHEDDVASAMIRSASVRWDLRVETYNTKAGLVDKLRLFAGGIVQQER